MNSDAAFFLTDPNILFFIAFLAGFAISVIALVLIGLERRVRPPVKTCNLCGRPRQLTYSISDGKWEDVMGPTSETPETVCFYCFLAHAQARGKAISRSYNVWIKDLGFVRTEPLYLDNETCGLHGVL